jgi:hypothetical protein
MAIQQTEENAPPDIMRQRPTLYALIGILLLGAFLRLWGITWGIPDAEVPHRPHHYDEFISVITMMQINRHGWDLNPEGAHLGGTFVFFLWHATAEVLNAVGILDHLPHYLEGLTDPNYRRVLIMGRAVIVLFDLATIALLFWAGCSIVGRASAGLWAALFYAILPFQVIHTHFMRPHVAANFFVIALIYMSYLLLRRPHVTRYFVFTGVILGVAMATLYQLFALVMIPYLAFCYRRIFIEDQPRTLRNLAGTFFNWRVFMMGGIAFVAFFLGCPFLFLDYEAARPFIESQSNATDHEQFYLANLLDLSKPWLYIRHALPIGMFLLVVPAYTSMVYMLFRRKYYGVTLPVLAFSALYVYYATKGYGLYAIRALLYLFPIFALFTGMMLTELHERWQSERPYRVLLNTAIAVLFIPSLLFTMAYVYRMADRDQDPYVQVHRHFQNIPVTEPLRVGFVGWEWDRYHVPNFGDILNATHHEVTVSDSRIDYLDPEHAVDYLLLFNFDSTMHERVDETLAQWRASDLYAYQTTFSMPLNIGPLNFNYDMAPTDFRYPFPVIHLFARR